MAMARFPSPSSLTGAIVAYQAPCLGLAGRFRRAERGIGNPLLPAKGYNGAHYPSNANPPTQEGE